MGKADIVKKKLREEADPEKAVILQRFFKTGPGEYGEGDVFLGVVLPKIRGIVKNHYDALDLEDVAEIIRSRIHEERLSGLLILVLKYGKGDEAARHQIFKFYLENASYVNNWDLVDLTAEKIIGAHLYGKDASLLYKLAISENVWERRMAIIATFHFIKKGEAGHTLAIAKKLLRDENDLIHKASGWMLREVGRRIGIEKEETFLKKYYKIMPRTMLRYAIERFPEKKRLAYLKGDPAV
ncbi:MAG: DNA alkylation repair protein [Candidatus Omnitrophica bacterium]|nr:DNA alkylation repair protein [Candidatus Omnitrophota bacterium]